MFVVYLTKQLPVANDYRDGFFPRTVRLKSDALALVAEVHRAGGVGVVEKAPTVTARKAHGDDTASWAVYVNGREVMNGLTRSEVDYEKRVQTKRWVEKRAGELLPKPKTPAYPKFKSLRDAFDRAAGGDEKAQRAIIGCLSNFGAEHLAYGGSNDPKYRRHYRGLGRYVESLVGEYGVSETDAERDVLTELNAALTYSDDVKLTDDPPAVPVVQMLPDGGALVTLPTPPTHCPKCGRPVSGRVDSPYAPWDVPVFGPTGPLCTYCDETTVRNYDPLRNDAVPPSSRAALEKYLALKS